MLIFMLSNFFFLDANFTLIIISITAMLCQVMVKSANSHGDAQTDAAYRGATHSSWKSVGCLSVLYFKKDALKKYNFYPLEINFFKKRKRSLSNSYFHIKINQRIPFCAPVDLRILGM